MISDINNHIMSLLLGNDRIVRAVADTSVDFLDNGNVIVDDNLPEFGILNDNLRIVLRDGKIYRFALRYDRFRPYLYDDTTQTSQASFVFFDTAFYRNSRYSMRQNELIVPYEIFVNVWVNNMLTATDYGKTRAAFISEEIADMLSAQRLGRGTNLSIKDTELIYDRPAVLAKARAHGREMLFVAYGSEGCD